MKKTLLAICLLVVLLFSGCQSKDEPEQAAQNTSQEPKIVLPLSDDIKSDEEGTIENDYFKLTLPRADTWSYTATSDKSVVIYNIASEKAGCGGILCTIEALDPESFSVMSDFAVAGMKDNYLIVAEFPSDVQMDVENEQTKEDYEAVFEELKKIGTDESPITIK